MGEYISQEALTFFGIKNISFLDSRSVTVLVQPLSIRKDRWLCTCSSECSESGILRLRFSDENASEQNIPVRTQKRQDSFSLSNCYEMILEEKLPDFLSEKIKQYRKLMIGTEKRKEQRFPVGQENWRLFSLKKPDCTLNNLHGISIPCVVINASAHGAAVIGTRSLSFHVDEKCLFAAEFMDKRIAQNAVLVNTESIQEKFWRYSLHFTGPVSLTWLTHLNELAMQLEDK